MGQNEEGYSQVDSELQDLLGDSGASGNGGDGAPDFSSLFEEEAGNEQNGSSSGQSSSPSAEDLEKQSFAPIEAFYESPKPFFKDKNFYQKVLTGEGEVSKRLHSALAQFLKADEAQDRTMYRLRIPPIYWELYSRIAGKVGKNLSEPKRLMLRFGILLPTMISKAQRDMIAQVIMENRTGEPVLYSDEWLEKVAYGEAEPLATDEDFSRSRNSKDTSVLRSKKEKAKGTEHAQLMLLLGKQKERDSLEEQLRNSVNGILTHTQHPKYSDLTSFYEGPQRTSITTANALLRKLSNLDREMQAEYKNLQQATKQVEEFRRKINEEGGDSSEVDTKLVDNEVNSIRQIAKMSVGRQGNHFPLLMKQYVVSRIEEIGTRENILNEMSEVESIDPGLFKRSFKGQINRIVPYVILLPCYGDTGICWEPFEKYNRATSRGRVGIPMYPKDLKIAVITALADLRWQVAKEKAQHYWMQEGLTGKYYQWFSENKMKGDVKVRFIEDYQLWITKESKGVQKLDREVRGIFWRNLPFPDELKQNLKNRGYVYSELYKKDSNRAMSDGY